MYDILLGDNMEGKRIRGRDAGPLYRDGDHGNGNPVRATGGKEFAELDSTHLLYLTDKLVPVEAGTEKKYQKKEDIKKTIEEEREFISGSAFQESLKNIDQSCEGGG